MNAPNRHESSIALLALLIFFAIPLASNAQIPSGCHPITAEERAALLLREATIPATGIFCDKDRALLFGSCTTDPLPILLAQYTPGTVSSAEGNRGITKLQPEFACRLSKFRTAHPGCIVSAWRSNESQKKLWDEALKKYGSEAEARKYVAPPGKSRHNTGLAADLCALTPAAKAALSGFELYIRLEYEPWHVEGIGIIDNQATITESPGWVPPSPQYYPPPSPAYGIYGGGGGSNLSYLSQLLGIANSVSSYFSNSNAGSNFGVRTEGTTYYITANPGATSTVSLADILLAVLAGSPSPTIVFTAGSSTVTLTPDILATLKGNLNTVTTSAAESSQLTAPATDERIRALMLQVITLLQEFLRRLTESAASL